MKDWTFEQERFPPTCFVFFNLSEIKRKRKKKKEERRKKKEKRRKKKKEKIARIILSTFFDQKSI